MGCCFSCNEDEESQSTDNSLRQPLIDPVSNTTPVVRVPHSDTQVENPVTGAQSVKGQEDELAKILQETASAMIDVSASGSHSLDQREFQERSRHYLQKIQTLSPVLLHTPVHLLGDVPNPDKQLGASLISQEDINLMNWAMDEVEKAMHSIRVEHSEDLVVAFGGQQPSLGAGD